MTWTWGNAKFGSGGFRNASVPVGGGTVGSVSEAKQVGTWPEYEAEYLKRALGKGQRKYEANSPLWLNDRGETDETMRHVYLDNVTKNYKSEAEQALKQEFELWLQGRHPANDGGEHNLYENGEGKPVRRWTYQQTGEGGGAAGDERTGWRHTNWGKAELTHLPGVRDYLRHQYEEGMNDEIKMNLLAEHGPQDLEQAWMYFKHWVKGRPISDAVSLVMPRNEGRTFDHKAPWFNRMPHSMNTEMDTQQLQGTRQVTGQETPLPAYGARRQASTVTDSQATIVPPPLEEWEVKLARTKKAAAEISAQIAAGQAEPATLHMANRAVERVAGEEESAVMAEAVRNINHEISQAAAVRDELQNDATRAGLDPERDESVLVAQETGNIVNIASNNARLDLAVASLSRTLNDLRLNREDPRPVSGPDAILSRPGWPSAPAQVF